MAEFDEDGFADAVESSEAITSSNVTFPQSMKEESVITELPEKDLEKAMLAKEAGNNLFRQKEYLEALKKYSEAIDLCPQEPQLHEQLSIFYGNRAACYSSLSEHQLVIEDCSSALELNSSYLKVLVRRSQSCEALEKYDEALSDMKKVLELDPAYPRGQQTIARLQRKHDEKLEEMKTEALGKLKELGNSFLGNFGMSLDSFKMEQDKTTGSWSISMNNNK